MLFFAPALQFPFSMPPLPDLVDGLYAAIDAQEVEQIIYYANVLSNLYESNQLYISVDTAKLISAIVPCNVDICRALARLVKMLLLQEDFPVIWDRFGNELKLALQSNIEELCILAVDILFTSGFSKGHGSLIISKEKNIINPLLNIIAGENLAVAAKVSEGLKGLKSAEISALVPKLLELYAQSIKPQVPVVQFRFLELFLALSVINKDTINISELLDAFFSDIKALLNNHEDQLMLSNAIITVEKCIQCRSDFDLLQQGGIITELLRLLPQGTDDLHVSATHRVLDFVAHCAVIKVIDREFIESTNLVAHLRRCTNHSNELIVSSAIYAIGALAESTELLDTIAPLLPSIEEALIHGVGSVQMSALHSTGLMYRNDCSESQVRQTFLIRLNNRLNGKLFFWIFERCLSNFDEQKRAAYFALKGIMTSRTGLKLALDTSTITTDLINRESDVSLPGLTWKYSILEAVFTTDELCSILNQALREKIQTYLRQGVVFVPRSTQVAFESEQ